MYNISKKYYNLQPYANTLLRMRLKYMGLFWALIIGHLDLTTHHFNYCPNYDTFDSSQTKINGITVVAPPASVTQHSLSELKNINANWVALVPYGFSKKGETTIQYNLEWQWRGETSEGIIESIQSAKSNGLNIMLKPQLYIHNMWIGDVDFLEESQWLRYESEYSDFILFWLKIAIEYDVDLFCIGTEHRHFVTKRKQYWKELISHMRCVFGGQLVYSSNWDDYHTIPFWDKVDFIGINAYFPLSDSQTPSISELVKKWRPIKEKLIDFSHKYDKPILFTEYGYLTVDGCAGKAWELEKKIHSLPVNTTAQLNAYESLWQTWIHQKEWAGGFLWKWFPDGNGHEGYFEKDYTPQNKPSTFILKKWFSHKPE